MKRLRLFIVIILCLVFTIVGFCKWYLPESYYDPDNKWNNETFIYDDDNTTAGDSVIAAKTWSSFILLDVYSELYCEMIKFLAYQKGVTGIEQIDIDLYYNSQWNDLYEGVFEDQVWTQKLIGSMQYLYSARIRFYAKKADTALLYGFEFWNLGVTELITMDYSFQGQPFVNVTSKSSIDLTKMDYAFQGQPFISRIEVAVEGWPHKWNTQTISKWNTKEIIKWNGLE